MEEKIQAYYVNDDDGLITVVEKEFWDENWYLDDGQSQNITKIEDAMAACDFSPIGGNCYEYDLDKEFDKDKFEATAYENGIEMIFNSSVAAWFD